MNKFLKVLIAIIGAFDVVFSIFIPISIALLIITVTDLSHTNYLFIIVVGFIASFYRGIKFFIN